MFCPECGARVAQPAAASPQPVMGTPMPPVPDSSYQSPPAAAPQEKPSLMGRRGVVVAVIVVLVVLLIGTTFESGLIGPVNGSAAINSANDPLTGQQLYSAYATDQSSATTSYTNKTVYIQDTLDFGVSVDLRSGQYYSTVDQGLVILIWNNPSQVGQLVAGNTILAKCSVVGPVSLRGALGVFVYLQDCDLVKVQSASATTLAPGVPAANV